MKMTRPLKMSFCFKILPSTCAKNDQTLIIHDLKEIMIQRNIDRVFIEDLGKLGRLLKHSIASYII